MQRRRARGAFAKSYYMYTTSFCGLLRLRMVRLCLWHFLALPNLLLLWTQLWLLLQM